MIIETKFKISTTSGKDIDLRESNVEIVGDLPNYYICNIDEEELPTLIQKNKLDKYIEDNYCELR